MELPVLRLRHLLCRVVEAHHPGPQLAYHRLGNRENVAESVVEAAGDITRQFDVLLLVVAHRYNRCIVQQNVSRHQHRVREQPGADTLLLTLGLVLELRHP